MITFRNSPAPAARVIVLLAVLAPALRVTVSQELKHRSAPVRPAYDLSKETPLDHPVDVISSHRLSPPLRSKSLLRFSPDGSHLFIQDEAGIFVLSSKPLQILLYADIGNAHPAAFSADSQSVSALGRDLVLTTWHFSDPRSPQRRELPIQHGCLYAQLSPDAEWISCLTPDLVLDLYRTSELQQVYSQRLAPARFDPAGPALVPVGRNHDSPFSKPVGYMMARFSTLVDHGHYRSSIYFSPDAKFLLANEQDIGFRLELPSLKKSNVPGSIHKIARDIVGFPSADRVLVSDSNKAGAYQILALSSGEILTPVPFTADSVHLATNLRFVLLANFDTAGVTAFDLEKSTTVALPPNIGADIFADQIALVTPDGLLQLYRLGEDNPMAWGNLPLGPLPPVHTAASDSSLSTFALSLTGSGAVYDLQTGNRFSTLKGFRGASLASPDSAFLMARAHKQISPAVMRWTKTQTASPDSPLWVADSAKELIPSINALLSYSFFRDTDLRPVNGELYFMPFELRGLDRSSGRELWHHSYSIHAPITFSDPQGSRVVLGWKARTQAAQNAARPFLAAREAFKKAKVNDQDTFFEVIDGASGASIGGVLVRFGSGPISFDSAFSVGNFLVLTKDYYRITIFRLNDGSVFGRFIGNAPAINEATKLLALEESPGKLGLFNLDTGARLAERRIPDLVSYLRFSEQGDRLLVLTAHQMAYILDVKKTIETFPEPISNPPLGEPAPENP